MMAVTDNTVAAPLKTVTLRDGSTLIIRNSHEGDAARLMNLAQSFSASTMFSILFKSIHAGSHTAVEQYTRTDDPSRRTILAEIVFKEDGGLTDAKPLVGVAHYWRVGEDMANLTIVVGDPWQGLGVGKALFAELSKQAAADGVRRFHAFFGQDNAPMLALLNKSGLEARLLPGNEPVWEIFLDRSPQNQRKGTTL